MAIIFRFKAKIGKIDLFKNEKERKQKRFINIL